MRLLGLDFADLDAAAAALAIAARPAEAPFGYVVTPNADHLVRLANDAALAAIYRDAWLRLLDSRVVSVLAGHLGLAVPRVAAGSDVTRLLFERHIRETDPVVIIGLRREALPVLKTRYRLGAVYHFDPPMGFDRDPAAFAEVVAFILAHPARFVFLAVGSPRQEHLAAAVAAAGRDGRASGTALCIGASLDFLCGRERRAPAWMRRYALEWAWRLMREPRRMARRYFVDSPRVLPLLWRARGRRHARRHSARPGDQSRRGADADARAEPGDDG